MHTVIFKVPQFSTFEAKNVIAMFGDLMNKLKETQDKMNAAQTAIASYEIKEQSADGSVQIVMAGNGILKDIKLDESALADIEMLEDLLLVTLNKATEAARKYEKEVLENATRIDMPVIPGMENYFKP
jgi:hypothetical protein